MMNLLSDVREKYSAHRRNARRRGIPFSLTFAEWWGIWWSSGHWHERGKHRGQYQMTRQGDCGAYESGNVKIQTIADNNKEETVWNRGYKREPFSAEHRAKLSRARKARDPWNKGLRINTMTPPAGGA